MAKITTGSTFGLNARQAMACRLLAEGNSEEEVMAAFFHVTPASTYGEKQKARKTLHKWMREPGFQECFRAIVKEVAFTSFGPAVARIRKQVDDNNGWLANKAANDILTRFGPAVMGEESREVVVRVEGAPVLGAPPVENAALPAAEE